MKPHALSVAPLALALVTSLSACASSGQNPGADTTVHPGSVAVTGRVLGEPGCPGPARLDSPCPPRPMAGAAVEADGGGQMAARATTDSGGNFRLSLPPGTYRITATATAAEPLKSTAGKDIVVTTTPMTVDLTVDSGMR